MIHQRFISKGSTKLISVPIIWVLGGPGSGKTTQCVKIANQYKFTHLITGDLLRAEIGSGTTEGRKLHEILRRGELVSNQIMLLLLKKAMSYTITNSKGFAIDGFPREENQGKLFEKQIAPVDKILYFDVSNEILMSRLLERLKIRVDETEELVKLKLKTFYDNNDKVLAQYINKLITVDSSGSPDEIFAIVKKHLDTLVSKKR